MEEWDAQSNRLSIDRQDIETEQMRMVECSMEYNQKQHMQMIMDDESDSGSYVSRPKSVKSSKSYKSSKSNELEPEVLRWRRRV